MNTSYLLPFPYAYCEGENEGESGNSLEKIVKRKLEMFWKKLWRDITENREN